MKIADLALEIRRRRQEARLTLTALAERAHVSRATLDAFENGRKSDIGVKTLERIANALGLEVRLGPRDVRRPTLQDLLAEQDAEPSER